MARKFSKSSCPDETQHFYVKMSYATKNRVKMKKYLLSVTLFLLHIFFCQAQNVVLYKKGAMYYSNSSEVYVKGSIEAGSEIQSANVTLDGDLYLGGTFVQNAENPVFDQNSSGKLYFIDIDGISGTGMRRITSNDETSFDRSNRYVAFPNVVIDTNDSIKLPHRMGMDAQSIKRANAHSGLLYLESKIESDGLFDASLRITSSGTSADLVDAGAVIIEKDVEAFRTQSASGLLPFASPFNGTQKSGYFAGNWVRRPTVNVNNNYHTQYVLGNKPSKQDPNIIDLDQYIIDPHANLAAGSPNLIKLRPLNFDYEDLKNNDNGLSITNADAADYKKNKFIFNGDVYTFTGYEEQLFAEDAMPEYKFTTATGTTVNWVMGNSYTAPISIDKLAEAMLSSDLSFTGTIYVYSPGAQSYTPIKIADGGIVSSNLKEIPAMSVFMLRISNKNTNSGSFKVTKDMLVHGTSLVSKPLQASSASGNNGNLFSQINLRVTPEDNPFVYDIAAIGLRNDASFGSDSYDMAAIPVSTEDGFNLYTQSASGSKLAVNGIPSNAESVDVYFNPSSVENNIYKLSFSNQETLSTEGAWLEDLAENKFTNLMQDQEYVFSSNTGNDPKRFKIHFKKPENVDEIVTGIDSYYVDDRLTFINLSQEDLNSTVNVYDVQGRSIMTGMSINNYPSMQIPMILEKGIYIVQLKGKRNYTSKILKR